MSSSNSSNKKAKKNLLGSSNEKEDFETQLDQLQTLRQNINNCNDVPSACRAVQVALKALDGEVKKVLRDEKLRKKFAICTTSSNSSDDDKIDDYHKVEKQNGGNEDDFLMEWQDVQPAGLQDVCLENSQDEVLLAQTAQDESSSDLGRNLADFSVKSIASSSILISSPLFAIALVLHGALVSDILQFRCTGIPELNSENKKESGFAPPIRQLPKGKFLPDKWDANSKFRVALRYRKEGYGAAVLIVSLGLGVDQEIQIYFGSSGDEKEQTPLLNFSPDKHVNLDSLDKAISSSSGKDGVSPSLHYKSLSILLTEFAKCIDLGQTHMEEFNEETDFGEKIVSCNNATKSPSLSYASYQPPNISSLKPSVGNYMPPIDTHRPIIQDDILVNNSIDIPTRGDFEIDLNPLVGGHPKHSSQRNTIPGNLMGPNHPAFQGGEINDQYSDLPGGFPLPGGLGMEPRFDSYYPPGAVGRFPGRGRSRGRGGRGRHPFDPTRGNPNPDHQRPPSHFGGNMFM
mmetsp:Transcript_22669/g.21784  ORF Transcript_22669/g.21784 Transcript_22669/m.21784 type:complete len:515 (-) Transcript_22669:188-1732(-)